MNPLPNLIIASSNQGKLAEYAALLEGIYTAKAQSDFNLTTPPETGVSFKENALIKANFVYKQTGYATLADDSGLEVDALGGAPGVFSARYAGPNACDTDNLTKLLKDIANIPEKDLSARFHCVIAYVTPTLAEPVVVHGVWEGSLVHKPQGNNGFGYDPIFYLAEEKCTSAQLSSKRKNQLSHRMQALSRLKEYLNKADV